MSRSTRHTVDRSTVVVPARVPDRPSDESGDAVADMRRRG